MVRFQPAHFRDRLVAAARLQRERDVCGGAGPGLVGSVDAFSKALAIALAQDEPVRHASALHALKQGVACDGVGGENGGVGRLFAVKDGIGEDRVQRDEPPVLGVDELLALDVGGHGRAQVGGGVVCAWETVAGWGFAAAAAVFVFVAAAAGAGVCNLVEEWREFLFRLKQFYPP